METFTESASEDFRYGNLFLPCKPCTFVKQEGNPGDLQPPTKVFGLTGEMPN
jgi:hypothetical protein